MNAIEFLALTIFASHPGHHLFSQTTEPTMTVKAYAYIYPDDTWIFRGFKPAVMRITKEGNFAELEITTLFMRGASITTLKQFGFRGEYSLSFFKQKQERKITPSLGLAAEPYVSLSRTKEMYSIYHDTIVLRTYYPGRTNYISTTLSVVPRVMLALTSRLYLDINAVLSFVELAAYSAKYQDPAVPPEQQSVRSIDADAFPDFGRYLRLGLGVRL